MKNYLLPNRYGDKNYLVYENNKTAYLKFDENASNCIGCTLSEGDKNEMLAIDPSGGPYIGVGSELNKKIVDRIYWNEDKKHYYIEFK